MDRVLVEAVNTGCSDFQIQTSKDCEQQTHVPECRKKQHHQDSRDLQGGARGLLESGAGHRTLPDSTQSRQSECQCLCDPSIQDVPTQGLYMWRHGPDPWGANASNTVQVQRRSAGRCPLMNAQFTKGSGKSC